MKDAFLNRMKQYLSLEEFQSLIKCYQDEPQRGLRLNQIDADTFFNHLKMPVEKISYDSDGYYLLDQDKYGNHPYHHLGAFYLQEPSAMAPVNMYSFKGNELVLDLCAAPGGKSSQLARRLNQGILFSNDPNYKRSKTLFSNLERLGFSNVVVLNETPQHLASELQGLFDVILVDAPCSGEGMMRKDEEALNMWNEGLALECQRRDMEILASANKLLKENGILIYSTCTFSKEENEEMIKYLIDEFKYEVIEAPQELLPYTKEGFIKNTLRFYPFTGRGEGQFMAVLRKTIKEDVCYSLRKNSYKDKDLGIVLDFLKQNLNPVDLDVSKYGNRYYANTTNIDLKNLNVLNYGIELGEVVSKRFVPYHHLFKALGKYFKRQLHLDVDDSRVEKYLHGEEIIADIPNGYGVIEIDGLYLGGFKAVDGHLKNHYPKGLRK